MPTRDHLLPTGSYMLIHTCEVCGVANAPFGYKVNLRRGMPGEWYCHEHKPQTASTRE